MSKKGASASQLTLVFINLLFVVVGVAAATVGGWVLIYREQVRFLTLLDAATNGLGLLQNAAVLLLVAGVVLFALGFVGCNAAFKDRRCLRVLYIGLVILCCVLTIGACVAAFFFREKVQDDLLSELQRKIKNEYQGFSTSGLDFSQAWDYAQVEFQCCGIEGYEDYKQAINWTVRNSAVVPLTCCVLLDKEVYMDERFLELADRTCARLPNSANTYIDTPCYQPLKDWMETECYWMGGVAIAMIVLQVLAALFLIAIMRKKPKSEDRLYRDNLFD